jgi:hypothetical protein
MNPVIKLTNVSKRFGRVKVVEGKVTGLDEGGASGSRPVAFTIRHC